MTSTTLKKISGILGISISTVSRALKDHPDISDKTKQRVLELSNTLEYEPNANAVNLRTSKSTVFGLIVPSFSNFFYDTFISSVVEESHRNNYSVMILQSGDDPAIEMLNLKLCRQNRISGLFACISSSTQDIAPFQKLKELEIPVIFFDRVPDNPDCNKVCVDDANAARIAAHALISRHKKNILAIFGDARQTVSRKRLDAFTKIVNDIAKITAVHAHSIEEAEVLTQLYLQQKPDSIFCMTDDILKGAMKAIQKSGLKVPDDISVIAISNGFIPKLYYPEIAYVEASGYKLGKLAFSSMMACLAGSTFVQELTIESILVEGGSL